MQDSTPRRSERVCKSPRLAQRLIYGVITYDDDDDADKVVCFVVLETIMKKNLHCTPLGVTFDCFVKEKMSRYYGQFV